MIRTFKQNFQHKSADALVLSNGSFSHFLSLFVVSSNKYPSQTRPHLLAEARLDVDDTHGDAADPGAADDNRLTPAAEVLLVRAAVEEPGHPARPVAAHLNTKNE